MCVCNWNKKYKGEKMNNKIGNIYISNLEIKLKVHVEINKVHL